MPSLQDIRAQYPQYGDMSDAQLADALHSKFYSDMPRDQFDQKIGFERRSGIGDFFKSIPRGFMSGMAGTASASGQAAQIEMGQPVDAPSGAEATSILEKNVTGELPKPEGAAGKFGATIGEFAGTPTSWVGPGGMIGKGVTTLGSAIGSETMGQLTNDNPYARFFGAVGGGLVPRGAAKAASGMAIPAERQASVDLLRDAGVEPTAGQATGSRALTRAESSLGEAFGSGGAGSREYSRVAREYTRAALREGIGEQAEHATAEVLNRARDRIGNTFERVAGQLPIVMDKKLSDHISTITADLQREGLPPDTVKRIVQQVENIMGGFVSRNDGRTIMDGKTYQSLTRKDTPLARAIDDADPNVSYYATRIRTAIDDAMERSATGRGTRQGVGRRQALEDLREARRQWYNSIVLSRAAAAPGEAAAEGLISPQKLRQLLTGGSPDRQVAYALGQGGGLQDLARAGNVVLSTLPNSNTSERAWLHAIPATIGGALGHAATGSPIEGSLGGLVAGSAAPGLTGRALMSAPVQNYLRGDIPGQGAARQALEGLPGAGTTALRSVMGEGSRPPKSEDDRLPPTSEPNEGLGFPGGVELPGFVHEAEKPNPVTPIVETLKDFAHGGLHDVLKSHGIKMPKWMDDLSDFLKRDDVNAALGTVGGAGAGKKTLDPKILEELRRHFGPEWGKQYEAGYVATKEAPAPKVSSGRVDNTERNQKILELAKNLDRSRFGNKRALGFDSFQTIADQMGMTRNAVVGVIDRARGRTKATSTRMLDQLPSSGTQALRSVLGEDGL